MGNINDSRPSARLVLLVLGIGIALNVSTQSRAAELNAVAVEVLPAAPAAAIDVVAQDAPASVAQRNQAVTLSNRFLDVQISLRTGLIEQVSNLITGKT